MIIGVDIDGVLANRQEWDMTHAAQHFAISEGDRIDPSSYFIEGKFGITKDQASDYWGSFIWDYAENVEPMIGAAEALRKLKDDGHTIIINTARWLSERNDEQGARMRSATEQWLKKHGLLCDKLVFAHHFYKDKLHVAKELALDIHIDDLPREIELLAPSLPVLIFDNAYNQDFSLPNTRRVKSWDDLYKTISKM